MEDVKTLNRIELEFALNTSSHLLFNRLSNPSGLAEWFADDVNLSGKIFTFFWDETQLQAELLEKKENKMIKFRWLKEGSNPKNYFAFIIVVQEMTGGVALQIVEQLDENEDPEESISLWTSQIGENSRHLIWCRKFAIAYLLSAISFDNRKNKSRTFISPNFKLSEPN